MTEAFKLHNYDNVYFLGIDTAPARPELLGEPRAPSNYKNPEAIARYKEETRLRYLERADRVVGVARVVQADIYHLEGTKVFSSFDRDEHLELVSPALALLKWLSKTVDKVLQNDPGNLFDRSTTAIVGFNIERQLRIAEAINDRVHGSSVRTLRNPLWSPRVDLLDPLKMVYDDESLHTLDEMTAVQLLVGPMLAESVSLVTSYQRALWALHAWNHLGC
jgi:hypothetical protein